MKEASRDIELRFDFASTEKLRNITTLGCQAIHYSGHGHPDYLSFEDGAGALHMVDVETLRSLCAAGGAGRLGGNGSSSNGSGGGSSSGGGGSRGTKGGTVHVGGSSGHHEWGVDRIRW